MGKPTRRGFLKGILGGGLALPTIASGNTGDPAKQPEGGVTQAELDKMFAQLTALRNERREVQAESLARMAERQCREAAKRIADFDEVVVQAEGLLDAGDALVVRKALLEGRDGAMELYKRAVMRIMGAGGQPAKLLRARFAGRRGSKMKQNSQ